MSSIVTVLLYNFLWILISKLYLSLSPLEDIDPSIGRFRNMVQTTVIPSKVPHAIFITFSLKHKFYLTESMTSIRI